MNGLMEHDSSVLIDCFCENGKRFCTLIPIYHGWRVQISGYNADLRLRDRFGRIFYITKFDCANLGVFVLSYKFSKTLFSDVLPVEPQHTETVKATVSTERT
ncbi:hypothetical protein DLM75_21770 [Leptospira stimsonii]|uniref:Uncharacterized protein n=1 Tax=Leptospira stimsonii TaxID=2202203 RepID=A0A396YUV1_9LEPT|nr:hypothetical protein DLM75_21770 [Leptospira stimsonii]